MITDNRRLSIGLFLLFLTAAICCGWDYYQFDLPSEAPEAAWRDALAAKLKGQHEVPVEGGRIDVMTDTLAIEIDWPHKWHEGLGQSLHYAQLTGKQGVLALVSYSQGLDNLREKSRQRFDMVENVCKSNGIRLIVLFPSKPKSHEAGTPPPLDYWLNTQTGVRHAPGCRYYGSSLEGRPCSAQEGKPCSLCIKP